MKIGSDLESTIFRVAKLAGVAAAVSAAPSRDAKMQIVADSLGDLAGNSHEERLRDAEMRLSTRPRVTPRAPRPPSGSRKVVRLYHRRK